MNFSQEQQAEIDLAKTFDASLQPDTQRGFGWHAFKLNGWHLWFHGSNAELSWVAAKYKNRQFVGHQYFKTLQETLQFCSNNA